jgi:hypothetical protein
VAAIVRPRRRWIGCPVWAVAGVRRAVWVTPPPRSPGHRSHAGRSSSIESWHFAHLPLLLIINVHDLAPGKPSTPSSTCAPAAPAAERAPRPRRRAQPAGETGTKRGPSGWSRRAHRCALQPCVTVGRLPRLRDLHRTVAFAAAGHRTLALWPCSIKSWHITHLPSTHCEPGRQSPAAFLKARSLSLSRQSVRAVPRRTPHSRPRRKDLDFLTTLGAGEVTRVLHHPGSGAPMCWAVWAVLCTTIPPRLATGPRWGVWIVSLLYSTMCNLSIV